MQLHLKEAADRFNAHIAEKAMLARARYGPRIDAGAILTMLEDRDIVRYPVSVAFDSDPLQPHEFAWPKPLGFHPSDGFCLFVHTRFEDRRECWPLLIAYHIPAINYGTIACHDQAELFGATVCGMERDAYYRIVCALADDLGASAAAGSQGGRSTPR